MTAISKAQFGAVSRYAKQEINNAGSYLAAGPLDLAKLQTTLVKLHQYESRITELSDQLLITLDDSEVETEVNKHEQLKADMLDAIAKLDICIASLTAPRENPSAASSHVSGSAGHGLNPQLSVKLPKLDIPPFDGDPLNFQEFWDAFEATIHNNDMLSPVEKLNYLRSYLRGDAKNPVAGYSLVAANYNTVVSVLKQRFGNKELIIYNHLDSLISLPPTGSNVSDLQRTTDECERHIRSLVNLGMEEDTFGRVFVPIIMSKLPTGLRISLHKKQTPGHCWTLTELREALQQEIYARQMGTRSFGATPSSSTESRIKANERPRWRTEDPRRRQATASTLTNTSKSSVPTGARKCYFCGGEHFSTECRKYPDSESRRKVIGESCFNCLGRSHRTSNCRSNRSCYYCKSNRHHSSLCNKQFGVTALSRKPTGKTNSFNVNTTITEEGEPNKIDPPSQVTTTVLSHGKRGILQTAVASIHGSTARCNARILFDNGASNAFLTTKAANAIGAKRIGKEVVALAGFQDKKRKSTVYPVYEVGVKLLNGTTKTVVAYGTDVITSAIERHPIDTKQNPLLAKLQLADPIADNEEDVEIDLLLGSDYYYEFVNAERITLQNGIILLGSELGYIVAGRLEGSSSKTTQLLLTQSQMPDTNFDLERLWRLEEVGIVEKKESEDDESAVAKLNASVFFNGEEKRYYVKWPLKEDTPDLPTNFKLAYGRLKSMLNKLRADPSILDKYHNTILEQQETGIIELASPAKSSNVVHYIPHHGVLTPQKATTKLRIVYDASSKITKSCQSLNDCMHRGPVILQDLCGLLARFRTKPIALVSDVEKAFLQIGLHEPDRDLVRFLWLKNPNKPVSYDNTLHYRFRRVCFGIIASPFLLAAVIQHHLQNLNTSISRDILHNVYVDNVVSGANTDKEAVQFYHHAKQSFSSASMNIREWYSNSNEVIQQIPQSDRGEGTTTKVLGMKWDQTDDTLSLAMEKIDYPITDPITKRMVLRRVAKIFDPCGYFAPVTISGKFLLQQLWQKKYAWDDQLPEVITTAFKSQVSEWQKIPYFKIPRLAGAYFGLESARIELHCFSDASIKAYSAALYIKVTTNSSSNSNLIFAKARVSPLKTQSVPRLELTAVFVGTKLTAFLETELKLRIDRKVIWTDSQCVLHWVLGKPVSTRFVQNRVAEIKKYTNLEFRYVRTSDNPADLPTRGISYNGLTTSSLWWHGPSWLTQDENQWPTMPETIDPSSVEPITQVSHIDQHPSITEAVSNINQDTSVCSLVDIARFSSLEKAVTTAGYINRFCSQMSNKSRAKQLMLTSAERQQALLLILKEAQARHNAMHGNTSSTVLLDLGLHTDSHGLVRCSTRIQHADLPECTKKPILLPGQDQLTKLIIQECHERLLHAGLKHTLAELRYRYWVVRGRSVVKRVLRQCLLCHRQRGKPYQVPSEPPLPAVRVRGKRAFATVGIDYLGPLIIHPPKGDSCKVWLCLFTCGLSRAIHLEVVTSMSTEAFLLALRRFMASWGTPEVIISDNAKQFRTAKDTVNRLWYEILRARAIQTFVARKGIEWKFIVELAPWMGGFYERMVGIAKASLKSAIQRKHLDMPELQTVVCEIITVINSRPLVYCEDELGDHPITPSHLIGRHWSLAPLLVVDGEESYLDKATTRDKLLAGWKRLQNVVDEFWKSWNKQYLTSLREKKHSLRQQNKGKPVAIVGDIVLLGDKNLPRGRWKIGRICCLNTSNDGLIRSASVKLPDGKCLRRSITMLYPLEVPHPSIDALSKSTTETSIHGSGLALESEQDTKLLRGHQDSVGLKSVPRKSKRKAAIDANARIRLLADDESD